jgi:hypothetical protein
VNLSNSIEINQFKLISVLFKPQLKLPLHCENTPTSLQPWTKEYVKSVTGACYTELGEKNGQIHCHAILCCVHRTKLRLDLDKIKEYVCRKMGLKNIFIRCNILRDSTKHCLQNYVDYIKKNYEKRREKLQLEDSSCSETP